MLPSVLPETRDYFPKIEGSLRQDYVVLRISPRYDLRLNIVINMQPSEDTMGIAISVILLLGAAVLGAWRLETEFDRESRSQLAIQTLKQSDDQS